MPPTTWDVATFAQQQRDIDEIDTALPLLDAKHSALLKRQLELLKRKQELDKLPDSTERRDSAHSQQSTGSEPATLDRKSVAEELEAVEGELEDVALQRRGRLLMAEGCEAANRRMLEDVSNEFLTKAEREQLGALRVKLRRILVEYGQ